MQTKSSPARVSTDLEPSKIGQISVVIPAYNASAYLPATLKSVFDQSARPGEVIVVDDGSTDDTVALALSFGVKVISLANSGPSAARNAGTKAASGEYIAFLDADDLWAPEKLAVQFKALQACGQPAFSFTDYRLFDEQGVHERNSQLRQHWAFRRIAGKRSSWENVLIASDGRSPILYDSYIQPSSVIVRRADVLAVGGFDETLRAAEDYEFFLRLFKLVPAVAVMKPLLFYRRHAEQATSNARLMKAGLFDIARRVAASPDRYPPADAQYIIGTEFLRHYTLGIEQARVGQFDAAVHSLESSLGARWTARASLALLGSRICRSVVGRYAFDLTRFLWKSRPGRRKA